MSNLIIFSSRQACGKLILKPAATLLISTMQTHHCWSIPNSIKNKDCPQQHELETHQMVPGVFCFAVSCVILSLGLKDHWNSFITECYCFKVDITHCARGSMVTAASIWWLKTEGLKMPLSQHCECNTALKRRDSRDTNRNHLFVMCSCLKAHKIL